MDCLQQGGRREPAAAHRSLRLPVTIPEGPHLQLKLLRPSARHTHPICSQTDTETDRQTHMHCCDRNITCTLTAAWLRPPGFMPLALYKAEQHLSSSSLSPRTLPRMSALMAASRPSNRSRKLVAPIGRGSSNPAKCTT